MGIRVLLVAVVATCLLVVCSESAYADQAGGITGYGATGPAVGARVMQYLSAAMPWDNGHEDPKKPNGFGPPPENPSNGGGDTRPFGSPGHAASGTSDRCPRRCDCCRVCYCLGFIRICLPRL